MIIKEKKAISVELTNEEHDVIEKCMDILENIINDMYDNQGEMLCGVTEAGEFTVTKDDIGVIFDNLESLLVVEEMV